jgi:hypothetical protein
VPLWATLKLIELSCTHLTYAVTYGCSIHCTLQRWSCNLLRYAAPSEPSCTQTSTMRPSSIELYCILLNHAAHYCATEHPSELLSNLRAKKLNCNIPSWAALRLTVLRCTLLNYPAPSWATMHTLSYTALYWPTQNPKEICCTLLSWSCTLRSYSVRPALKLRPFRATLHHLSYAVSELRCTLLSYSTPSELRCILLRYYAPSWPCCTQLN